MTDRENIYIQSAFFVKLKGLTDALFEFKASGLTAIMGVNGIGKSTVLHALACAFKPIDDSIVNYKFPQFFPPNPDASWKDSNFKIKYVMMKNKQHDEQMVEKEYGKWSDRWSPRYEKRPAREVYYLGIETCVPDIEKMGLYGVLNYNSKIRDDDVAGKIVEKAAYILNKDYEYLTKNYSSKKGLLSGVKRKSGINYSSLSMGCGEQRLLKIMEVVENASKYSLILIDEIDLLLHVEALTRLIECLVDIADKNKLQIIFTTHSTAILDMKEKVLINYITVLNNKTKVFRHVNSDCLSLLLGKPMRLVQVYVEDKLSQLIVKYIARNLSMNNKISVQIYGSVENAFLIAAAKIIDHTNIDNVLIVLDGDKYVTRSEKEKQLKKYFSGTERDHQEKIDKALNLMYQYNLPKGYAPENLLWTALKSECIYDEELKKAINKIVAVLDQHDYINKIAKDLDYSESDIINRMLQQLNNNMQFKQMTDEIVKWLAVRAVL